VNDFIDAVDVAYQLSDILNDPEPVQHTGSSFTTLQTCTPILLFSYRYSGGCHVYLYPVPKPQVEASSFSHSTHQDHICSLHPVNSYLNCWDETCCG